MGFNPFISTFSHSQSRVSQKSSPDDKLEAQASKPSGLIPIRIEFETEAHRIRYYFVWNSNDVPITPEKLASVHTHPHPLGQLSPILLFRDYSPASPRLCTIISALTPSTSHVFAMTRGRIYHAPFTATSSYEWKPLNLCGAIVFGRDTREYEIRDDASSGKSSLGSLGSAGTSGTSGSSGFMGFSGTTSEEPKSIGEVGGVVNLGGLEG